MPFTFSTARIVFNPGIRSEIAVHAARLGRRCLLVTGSTAERYSWLLRDLSAVMDAVHTASVSGEPETGFVAKLATEAREEGCTVVVAMGGGSVIDAGKAVAALVTNSRPISDFLEVVGRGMPLERPPLPVIAVPTTAGTGAEVTANSVLLSPEHGVKISLRSPMMIPAMAVIDPELAVSLPPSQTASTGMDALTQLMEAFVSHAANPLVDPLCRDGLKRVARSLRRVVRSGSDIKARSDMALASLFSGMALANARLGAVHGFAAPLGAALGAPHGELCAALLPHVMRANIQALRARMPGSLALTRYAEVGQLLTGNAQASPEDAVVAVLQLCADVSINGLENLGLEDGFIPGVVEKAARASSMQGNPIVLNEHELALILRWAMNG